LLIQICVRKSENGKAVQKHKEHLLDHKRYTELPNISPPAHAQFRTLASHLASQN